MLDAPSSSVEVELVLDARATLGEGPIWDTALERLVWVDIHNHQVHLFDPVTESTRSIDVGEKVGTVVQRESGGLLVALENRIAALDDESGSLETLVDVDSKGGRFNDGKCDPSGRFWAGTMRADAATEKGTLFRLDHDLSIHAMLDDVGISNGIVWNSARTRMYYIDTFTHAIDTFDYDDQTGTISNQRVTVPVTRDHGSPDGMAIDIEGKVWVAHWDGWRVNRWDPDSGDLLATIEMPVQRPTAVAFGGPEMKEIYVTSARGWLSDEDLEKQPHAGGLFRIRSEVAGAPTYSFRG